MATKALTTEQEQSIYDNMIATSALSVNKAQTESYISLSDKAIEINPLRVDAFNFLSKYDGKTFAGRQVTVKKHTNVITGEVTDAVSLTETPEWVKLIK